MEGVSAMAGMVMKGDIKILDTVIEGFEKMQDPLMGIFMAWGSKSIDLNVVDVSKLYI